MTRRAPRVALSVGSLGILLGVLVSARPVCAQIQSQTDPRVGLPGGHWVAPAEVISNLDMVSHRDKPAGFSDPANRGDLSVSQTRTSLSVTTSCFRATGAGS